MGKGMATFRKVQKQQQDSLKKKLLTEFSISVGELINDDELEPWAEVVDGKQFVLKSLRNVSNFGTFVLTFQEKGSDREIRLPLQLMLK